MTREAMAARLQQIWMPCGEAPCGACDDLQRDLLDWAEGIAQAACAEAVAAEREACAAVAETACLVVDEGATLTAGQAEDMARQLAARIALTIRRRPSARTPSPGGGAGEEAR